MLLIKMSSLGDVVHTLVPITDARDHHASLELHWVIEEAYQAIPHWHPAVKRVIPVALRRWRRSPWAMLRDSEWSRFRSELRKDQYDLVLDAQGLLKSAWIGTQARGRLVGRNRHSAREPLAAAFYRQRFEIDLALSEVEQLRQLFALALGYAAPDAPAAFGINPEQFASHQPKAPYAVLVHGAAWESKLWPVAHWQELARALARRGLKVLVPWGNEEEKQRGKEIAASCEGELLPKLGVAELGPILARAKLVVGLDTGLTHMAIALGAATITLYGPSIPVYGEIAGGRVIHLASTESRNVDTRRKNAVPLDEALKAVSRLMD